MRRLMLPRPTAAPLIAAALIALTTACAAATPADRTVDPPPTEGAQPAPAPDQAASDTSDPTADAADDDAPAETSHRFQVRAVAMAGEEAESETIDVPAPDGGTERLTVHRAALLDESAVAGAEVVQTADGRPVLTVRLTEAAAAELEKTVAASPDRKLVFLLDDAALAGALLASDVHGNATLEVSGMDAESLTAAARTLQSIAEAAGVTGAQRFAVRRVVPDGQAVADADVEVVQYPQVKGGTGSVTVRREPLLTGADLVEAELSNPRQVMRRVIVRFTPAAAERFKRAVVGDEDAKVVYLWDGKALGPPVSAKDVRNSAAIAPVGMDQPQREQLADTLNRIAGGSAKTTPPGPAADDGVDEKTAEAVAALKQHIDTFVMAVRFVPGVKVRGYDSLAFYVGDEQPKNLRIPPANRVQITKEQAEKVIDLLAERKFFQKDDPDVALDPSGKLNLKPRGPDYEWVVAVSTGEPVHEGIWVTYPRFESGHKLGWDTDVLTELQSLRNVLEDDGDAAAKLDNLLTKLEPMRKEWEAAATEASKEEPDDATADGAAGEAAADPPPAGGSPDAAEPAPEQ